MKKYFQMQRLGYPIDGSMTISSLHIKSRIDGFGHLELAADGAWVRTWLLKVSRSSEISNPVAADIFYQIVLRFSMAAIFSNFEVSIHDDTRFMDASGFVTGKGGERLELIFKHF
jgi:hypothetical protein